MLNISHIANKLPEFYCHTNLTNELVTMNFDHEYGELWLVRQFPLA